MHLQSYVVSLCDGVDNEKANSLIPGKFEWHFRYLIVQIISVINGWGISCELALRWMSLHLTDDKSTLVQVMAWCRQATSHYLSQWWPRSLSPYGVTRPQWVKEMNERASPFVCEYLEWMGGQAVCRISFFFIYYAKRKIPTIQRIKSWLYHTTPPGDLRTHYKYVQRKRLQDMKFPSSNTRIYKENDFFTPRKLQLMNNYIEAWAKSWHCYYIKTLAFCNYAPVNPCLWQRGDVIT